MYDTIIVSGGNIEADFALNFLKKNKKSKIVAADRGLEFCFQYDIIPEMAVGDFDSTSEKIVDYFQKMGKTEIIRLKPEKDDSDTQSICKIRKERGDTSLAILGGTGTRLDHVYANLELLAYMDNMGVRVALMDAHNLITIVHDETILYKEKIFGKYVSFFPLGNEVEGLTLDGFKYPLKDFQLRVKDGGLTVSNELLEEKGYISYKKGTLLMIMSQD